VPSSFGKCTSNIRAARFRRRRRCHATFTYTCACVCVGAREALNAANCVVDSTSSASSLMNSVDSFNHVALKTTEHFFKLALTPHCTITSRNDEKQPRSSMLLQGFK
jgi:hypothetical protein